MLRQSVCRAEPEGVPLAEGPCPTNDMVLCLLHSCLGQELSDREIPLTPADQAAFLNEVLRRSCRDPGELPSASPMPRFSPPLPHGGFHPSRPFTSEPCPSADPVLFHHLCPLVGPEGPPVGGHAVAKDRAGNSTQASGDSTLPSQVSTAALPCALTVWSSFCQHTPVPGRHHPLMLSLVEEGTETWTVPLWIALVLCWSYRV